MSQNAETNIEPTTPTIESSAAAKRMRYHRERRREGIRCVTIELRETEVTQLIRRKLLNPGAGGDLRAIRSAIHLHLDDTLSAKGDA
jgi:hypothetical protein